jgi:glycosyltransferase involved in cell wall biosynthesis
MPVPLVTVVLPTHDRFKFLPSAVQSIFQQTMRDWELVVADDGSGREARDYLETLNDDARVRTLLLPHSGNPGRVRNAAVAVARTPYVAFLDSDDLWEPRKLERQLAVMRAEEACDWSFTAVTFIDDDGKPLAVEVSRRWTTYRGEVFERILRDPALVRTPTVIVTAQLLRDVGGFDEAIDSGEDIDLWMRLALRSRACIVAEPLARIRYHAGNTKRGSSRPYETREYSLRKLGEGATPAQRTLLKRERSLNTLVFAVETATRSGRWWRALAMVGKSLPIGWTFGLWWYESAKALRACLLPSRARPRGGVSR